MKFYFFGGHIGGNFLQELEDHGFVGTLFTYRQLQGDFFTLLAKTADPRRRIKYMIAIRPHTISAQYLCMINQSINKILPNRLQINLISGHIKPDEKEFGGIIGDVTDTSTKISRSNYLIQYINELKNMSSKEYISIPDYYVSTTNPFTFKEASRLGNKMIIPYREYSHGYWFDDSDVVSPTGEPLGGSVKPGLPLKIEGESVMLAIGPIIRETQEELNEFDGKADESGRRHGNRPYYTNDTVYVTYDQFCALIKDLESKGIKELMILSVPGEETPNILKYIKRYTDSQKAVD